MAARWMQPKLDKMKRDGAVVSAARRNDRGIAMGDKLATQAREAESALIALATSYNGPISRLETGKARGIVREGKRHARLDTRCYGNPERPGICGAGALSLYNPEL